MQVYALLGLCVLGAGSIGGVLVCAPVLELHAETCQVTSFTLPANASRVTNIIIETDPPQYRTRADYHANGSVACYVSPVEVLWRDEYTLRCDELAIRCIAIASATLYTLTCLYTYAQYRRRVTRV